MGMTIIDGYRGIVIDSPGDYSITTDITSDGSHPAVAVNSNYVTLHLRSRLEGNGTLPGISANGAAALTILGEGGIIRDFHTAVQCVDCYSVRVINMDIFNCRAEGIAVNGEEIIIKNNNIDNIGGNPDFTYGIRIRGIDLVAMNNNVNNVWCIDPNDEAGGISFDDCRGIGTIIGNRIRANTLLKEKKQFGIWTGEMPSDKYTNAIVSTANNVIENWYIGAAVSFGKVTNNTFINCHDALERPDMDGGGNVVSPPAS